METPKHLEPAFGRVGRWLPRNSRHVDAWIRRLKTSIRENPRDLIEPIREFERMVDSDPVLHANVALMFAEAYRLRKTTPLGEPEVKTFHNSWCCSTGS
jgi:phosphatidylserine decarboxylase